MEQGREQNAGQPGELAWTDTETLQLQSERPIQYIDEPDQRDEAERDLEREPEIGVRPLGAGVVRVEDVNLHRGKRYPIKPWAVARPMQRRACGRSRSRRLADGRRRPL